MEGALPVNRRSLVLMIALLASVLMNPTNGFLSRAYAFGPTCQYSSVDYSYPNEVNPGQHFVVSISLPTTCPVANNYHVMARFDVENTMDRVLASNYTQYGFMPNNGKPFTFLVTNGLSAPSTSGAWRLQFVVYVFISEDDADGLDYKVQALETIQVGQQSTTTQVSNNTLTATTENSQTSTINSPTNASVQMATQPESNGGPSMIEAYIVALIVILGIAALILVKKRPKANHSVESREQPPKGA